MQMKNKNMCKKVLVVGFDAATFDIIKPMIGQGKLPNFKKMIAEGRHGNLKSTFPPITPPAWASFMTGKNPGKHDVYNFYYHSLDPSKDGETYFVNSHSIKANTIWEIISQKGKRNIVINVPVTYPLTNNINGIIISGLLTPNNAKDFCYPKEVLEEINQNVGHYSVDSHPTTDWSKITLKECLDYYIKTEEDRTKTAIYMLEKHPWDFFMVMYSFTDKILHLVYPHLHKEFPESRELRQYIQKTYEKADEILGRFLSAIDKNTTIIVASDHGFGHLEKAFMSNRWLVDNGFMNLKNVNILNFRELYEVKMRRVSLDKLLKKLNMELLRHQLPFSLRTRSISIPGVYKKVSRSVVDWSKTRAYGRDYGIRINLKGREKCGIVEPGEEYERVRDEIREKLYELRDPEIDEKIVDYIRKREELYSGPYLENAPDLMYGMKNHSYVQYNNYHFNQLFKRYEYGTHRMNGIFLVKGEKINKGYEITKADIVDMAPTIIYLMGLPVPDDMDGRVLSESFKDGVLKNLPIKYEPAIPLLRKEIDDGNVYTEQENEEIVKGLKGLGYLG